MKVSRRSGLRQKNGSFRKETALSVPLNDPINYFQASRVVTNSVLGN